MAIIVLRDFITILKALIAKLDRKLGDTNNYYNKDYDKNY